MSDSSLNFTVLNITIISFLEYVDELFIIEYAVINKWQLFIIKFSKYFESNVCALNECHAAKQPRDKVLLKHVSRKCIVAIYAISL